MLSPAVSIAYADEPMDSMSDEALMLAYCDGDAAAFDALYTRFKGPLYRTLLRQMGTHAADEVFQEVWTKLIQARTRYEVKATFKTYLYSIAHHCRIDHFRRNKKRILEEADYDDLPSHTPTPESSVDSNARAERLLELIQTLPDAQREAFLLREESGLTREQIAQATDSEPETVKSRLRYAVDKLREGMGGLYDQ